MEIYGFFLITKYSFTVRKITTLLFWEITSSQLLLEKEPIKIQSNQMRLGLIYQDNREANL